MSSNIVRRGYLESDKNEFNEKSMEKLKDPILCIGGVKT